MNYFKHLLLFLIINLGIPEMSDGMMRPQSRPPEPITELPYEDLEKIERVVWAEANTEGVEGRNAVRGVIFNRLASERFGDDIDSVLVAGQFEPLDTYGDIKSIPVPDDQLSRGMEEITDYIQLGTDASSGSTFFQNVNKTKDRGTDYGGSNAKVIGNHTFYDGYEGQEPVTDIRGSHNIKVVGMAKGGFLNKADAMKGRSEEDEEIAEEKEQVDVSKADTNGDGFASLGEREIQLALQKNELIDEEQMPMKAYHGGMACGCGGECEGECGVTGYDEVSGNPIPIGSTAENVRDDIDAKLSTDEYVLPANVVKWHGLKHIMDMQAEAEMGLMAMQMDGLIQHGQEEPNGEGSENSEVSDESDPQQEEAEAKAEASEDVASEEMDIEIATVEVDDHLDDDEETKKVSPKSKPLPAISKKQKFVFAI